MRDKLADPSKLKDDEASHTLVAADEGGTVGYRPGKGSE